MQFKVPQFLDIEDKIFGPFTFKEFIYLAGGGGICYVLYKALGLLWGSIPILIIGGFALALTFYRPNGKPFVNMLQSAVKYAIQDKLYLWKRRKKIKENKEEVERQIQQQKTELLNRNGIKLGGSKLRDLSWGLDVLDYKKEER